MRPIIFVAAIALLVLLVASAEATHRLLWTEEVPIRGDIRRRSFYIREQPDVENELGYGFGSRYTYTQGDGGCRGYAVDASIGRQYWSTWDSHSHQVYYNAVDSANQTRGQVYGSTSFASVGLTLEGARLYWIEYETSVPQRYRIIRRDVTGDPSFNVESPNDGIEQLYPATDMVADRLGSALAIDSVGAKMYWVEANQLDDNAFYWSYEIKRANLDGSSVESFFASINGTASWSLMVDSVDQRLYWVEDVSMSSAGDDTIYTSNFTIYWAAINDTVPVALENRTVYYHPTDDTSVSASGVGLVIDPERTTLYWGANSQTMGTYAVYSVAFATATDQTMLYVSDSRRLTQALRIAEYNCSSLTWMCGGNATLCSATTGLCDCQLVANSTGWTPMLAQCQTCQGDYYGSSCKKCKNCGRNEVCADGFTGNGKCMSTCNNCDDNDDKEDVLRDALIASLVGAFALCLFCICIVGALGVGYYRYRQGFARLDSKDEPDTPAPAPETAGDEESNRSGSDSSSSSNASSRSRSSRSTASRNSRAGAVEVSSGSQSD